MTRPAKALARPNRVTLSQTPEPAGFICKEWMQGALTIEGSLAAHGQHVMLDLTGYTSPRPDEGEWMLDVLRQAVTRSTARQVHAHVEDFDGTQSPPGFAAVVLLDESHLSAHCYSDRGWLAIDCFTCGGTDAQGIVDDVLEALVAVMPDLVVQQHRAVSRFMHPLEG